MKNNYYRPLFYVLFAIISSLLGWSLSQFVLDFIQLACRLLRISSDYNIFSYLLLFSIIISMIALGIVISELFSSNPTRHKLNKKILFQRSIFSTILSGVIFGGILGIANWYLLSSGLASWLIRVLSWTIIGIVVGLTETISWSFYSIEVTQSKTNERKIRNIVLGGAGGLFAAIIFEILRGVAGNYKEPLGFLLLGASLGLFLCFATRPNYQVALRAGQGFETVKRNRGKSKINSPSYNNSGILMAKAMLGNPALYFVPNKTSRNIEEGLSITLPAKTDKPIVIGSNENADIFIPDIPYECASLRVINNEVELECLADDGVQIQKKKILEGRRVSLKHNQILTFYHEDDDTKFYRFVFYNRFLDPQA
jgi:hypothetical protein